MFGLFPEWYVHVFVWWWWYVVPMVCPHLGGACGSTVLCTWPRLTMFAAAFRCIMLCVFLWHRTALLLGLFWCVKFDVAISF